MSSGRQENGGDERIVSYKGMKSLLLFYRVVTKFIYYSEYVRTGTVILCCFATGICQAIIGLQIAEVLGFKMSLLIDTDSTGLSYLSITIPIYGLLKLITSLNQTRIGDGISSRMRHGYFSEILAKPEYRHRSNSKYWDTIIRKCVNDSLMIQHSLSNTVWNIIENCGCFLFLITALSVISGIFMVSIICSLVGIILFFKLGREKLVMIVSSPLIWTVLSSVLLMIPSVIQEREDDEVNQGLMILICVFLAQSSLFQISEKLCSFLTVIAQIDEFLHIISEYNTIDSSGSLTMQPEIKQARIEFVNVNFAYPFNSQPSLINFDLTIEAGQTVGLVSDSTAETICQSAAILDLISGKFKPDSGQVLIDGQDPVINKNIVKQIASISAYNMDVIDGSIYDYVYKGLIGTKYETLDSVDQHRMIMRACKEAGLWHVAKNRSLQSQVGDGSILSVTERLKLNIAKSLVAKPKILLLDQPIALIDQYAQPFISSTLHQISKNRTTILVHYYGSALHLTDRVVVLSNGSIIEDDTHSELIKNCEMYQKLIKQWKSSKRRSSINSITDTSEIAVHSEAGSNYRRGCFQLLQNLKTISTNSTLLFLLFASLGLCLLVRIFIGVRTTMLSVTENHSYEIAFLISEIIFSTVELAIYTFTVFLWNLSFHNSKQTFNNLANTAFFSTIIFGQLILTTYLNWKFGIASFLYILLSFHCGHLNFKTQIDSSQLIINAYQSKQLTETITDRHTFEQFYDNAESDLRRIKRRITASKIVYGLFQTGTIILLLIASFYILYINVSMAEVIMIFLTITCSGPLYNGLLIPVNGYNLYYDNEM